MNTHFTSQADYERQGSVAGDHAPRAGSGARVWAGAVIIAGGLGLIVLGGCFLYGVLELVKPHAFNPALHEGASTAVSVLMVILYVMAFACFAGAAVLLVIGLWGLTRILMARPPSPDEGAP
jgi:hypothetical protein